MPKITAKKSRFFKLLGEDMSLQQLEDLSFEFGIEVEEDEDSIVFEIAANRADLLCVESLAYHLRLYLGREKVRQFKFLPAKEKIFVRKDTKLIRPFIVGAILRNVQLDQEAYESFIDMQDKLHHNLCRKRKLVAIGTHDLDKIKAPFYYDAQDPNKIVFKALKQQQELTASELFKVLEVNEKKIKFFLKNDLYLRTYLPIIKDSPVFPVVLDSSNSVLSLPPIINSEYSKMSAETKNIFIESTCTDYTRAQAALACLVSGFSQYCTTPFEIEMVDVIYEETGEVRVTPQHNERILQTTLTYINKILGINVDSHKVVQLLQKMGVNSIAVDDLNIDVTVPFYRTDILQQCDVAEDVGISYGYNNIVEKIPESQTFGGETRLNKLSDMVREEVALCGFVECLNFVLCSINEVTTLLNRPIDNNQIVHICNYINSNKKKANSKSAEFECARTTLISPVLKTLKSNSTQKLPVQLFEVSDVVIKGNKTESDGWIPEEGVIGAVNRRRLCALVSDNSSSGLDIIHGLLDQIMIKLKVPNDAKTGYYIEKSQGNNFHNKQNQDPCFFPGLQASVTYKGQNIGVMGVIHPKVLENIKWDYPTSLIEIDLEPLFKDFK